MVGRSYCVEGVVGEAELEGAWEDWVAGQSPRVHQYREEGLCGHKPEGSPVPGRSVQCL